MLAGRPSIGTLVALIWSPLTDVNWPRVLLGVWIVLTIGWLGFAGFFVWKLWPQYSRFFQTPDNPLYGAMVVKYLNETKRLWRWVSA